MKQKLLAWGDDYTIKDEAGQDVYFVDGKVFTWGKQLSFQDMAGNELLVHQAAAPELGAEIRDIPRREAGAVVTKELFTLFSCRFVVDVPGPDDLVAKGDFMDHDTTSSSTVGYRRQGFEDLADVRGHLRGRYARRHGRPPDSRQYRRHRRRLPPGQQAIAARGASVAVGEVLTPARPATPRIRA